MTELRTPPRAIGLGGTILINLNGAVGAGIFALPALLYASAGSFSPLAILFFAIFAGCMYAIPAKLSTIFEQSGGGQLYAEHTFGKFVGFQVGWFGLCANMGGRAANFHVLVAYLAAIFPFFGGEVARPVTIVSLIAFFCLISVIGTKRSIAALGIGTVLKLTPLIVLCIAGLALNGLPSEVEFPQFSEMESVAILIAYAFSGSATATAIAGETKNPQRTMFRAIFINLAVIAVFYTVIQLAYNAIAPDPSQVESPLAAAGEKLFGPIGTLMISLAAIFSIATNQLNSFVAVPRIPYGMGRRGLLPSFFAYVSPRFQTPAVAILIYSGIIVALALTGTFTILAALAIAAEQIVFFILVLALITLWRRNEGGLADTMGPRWIAVIAGALSLGLLLAFQIPAQAGLSTLGLLAVGLVLYGLARLGKHEHEEIRVGN